MSEMQMGILLHRKHPPFNLHAAWFTTPAMCCSQLFAIHHPFTQHRNAPCKAVPFTPNLACSTRQPAASRSATSTCPGQCTTL